jgi:hypothetical protein
MKNDVLWDVSPCRFCVNRRFGFIYLEDRGDTLIRNVSSHKIYTGPHLRKQHSSTTLLLPEVWECVTGHSAIKNRSQQWSKVREHNLITKDGVPSAHTNFQGLKLLLT